jgi:CRISPR-associated protein (TIGR02710 family)
VEGLLDLCEGFEAWDRFDHQEAISRLAPYISQSSIKPYGLFLKKVIASRGQLDRNFDTSNGMNGNGYEVVEDLLLNADRRANQQRYDDAVGRLYRALELLAQIRLFKTYEIQTGDVDITKLPESLQPEYEGKRNHKIQIGLTESYELLAKISDDALGQLYLKQKNPINNALQVRNYSLFAHGFQSIDESRYQTFNAVVANFITDGIAAVTAKSKSHALQFPKSL